MAIYTTQMRTEEVVSSATLFHERSSAEMMAIIATLLASLSNLSMILMKDGSERTEWQSQISQRVADSSKAAIDEVSKNADALAAQKANSETIAAVCNVLKIVLQITSLVVAIATLNPVLIGVTIAMSGLQMSGALDKLGDWISTSCGDNKMAAFLIKLGITVVLCALACGATAAAQGANVAAGAAAGAAVAANGAAQGAVAAQTAMQILVNFLKSPVTTAFFMSFGQTFTSLKVPHDLVTYCVESSHPNASKEEKQRLEEEVEIIINIVITLVSLVGSLSSMILVKNSAAVAANPAWLKQVQNFIQYGNGVFIAQGLASGAVSAGSICAGAQQIQQGNAVESLSVSLAKQEVLTQLIHVISQMSQHVQEEMKNLITQVGQMTPSAAEWTEDSRRLAELLASMAV